MRSLEDDDQIDLKLLSRNNGNNNAGDMFYRDIQPIVG